MSPRGPFKKCLGFDAGTVAALVAVWFLSITSVVSFLLPLNHSTRKSLSTVLFSAPEAATICETANDDSSSSSQNTSSKWLDKGLILSSFTDGLKANPTAVDWLMNALIESLWEEEQEQTQLALKESNLASPCNGPDPVLLNQLEETDRVVEKMGSSDWKENLKLYCETKRARKGDNTSNPTIDLRFLYIPTAMYALRSQSTSTPGKQRGRNRADGKKRRNEIMRLLQLQLEEFLNTINENAIFAIRTVTMDFDDASVKQPEEVVVGAENPSETGARFPETGKEAIREWKPHLIYVQGGNTFWLHHCMEKGDWTKELIDACFYNPNNDDETSPSFSAVYCGVSAGAILAGESMQTACWKKWDDPSVVPGKETYEDWTDIRGLGGAGRTSIFPHMTEEWQEVAERRTKELLDNTSKGEDDDDDSLSPTVRSIRDNQAYAVDGRRQTIAELI